MKSSSSSIGLLDILGVVFVVLKLTHVIDWSWWWVLAPFWTPLVIAVGLMLFVTIRHVIRHLKG